LGRKGVSLAWLMDSEGGGGRGDVDVAQVHQVKWPTGGVPMLSGHNTMGLSYGERTLDRKIAMSLIVTCMRGIEKLIFTLVT